MLKELCQLVHSVIARDKIRVPPSEGRLLRLSPPCALMIGTETVSVVSRTVCDTREGPCVTYACRTNFEDGILVVRLIDGFRCDVLWAIGDDSPRSIAEDDVVVFG